MGKRPLGRADKVKPSPQQTAPDAGPKLANMEEKWSFKTQSSVTYLTLNTDNIYRCHCLLFLIDLSDLVLPKIASVQLAPNYGCGLADSHHIRREQGVLHHLSLLGPAGACKHTKKPITGI